jgi:hypothetical protein
MIDLALSVATRDLDLTGGDLNKIDGDPEIGQHITTRFRFGLGEWPQDTRIGVPTVQQIIPKPARLALIQSIYQQLLITTPGVASLRSFALQLDSNRALNVQFNAQSVSGEFLPGTESLIFGGL